MKDSKNYVSKKVSVGGYHHEKCFITLLPRRKRKLWHRSLHEEGDLDLSYEIFKKKKKIVPKVNDTMVLNKDEVQLKMN